MLRFTSLLACLSLAALTLCVAVDAGQAAEPKHTKDSLETVRKNLKEQRAVLIDVRTEGEWQAGHLKDAVHVPLSDIQAGLKAGTLPKDKVVYLHCRSGGRVLIATELLKDQGYDLRPLKAGFDDLRKAGFEAKE